MFHVGQKVIRVAEWRIYNSLWRGTPIHKGEVHVIREICENDGLKFEGISDCLSTYGQICVYDAVHFAPYNPPAEYIEVTFSEMKQPKPCAS